jgi:hypothetical protein
MAAWHPILDAMRPSAALLAILFAASLPLAAGPIGVGGETYAWVAPGEEIDIQFGVWNYARNNPGSSPYPTQIGLQVLGQAGTGSLFEGWIESVDDTVSVPLDDPNADLLGLPAGSLLVTPGTFAAGGGAPFDVAVIDGYVYLSDAQSQALFGSNIGNYNSAAQIVLLNMGAGFMLGIGPGYTVRNAVSEPGIGGDGPVETAGITGPVSVTAPEPATWLCIACGLGALAFLARRRHRLS